LKAQKLRGGWEMKTPGNIFMAEVLLFAVPVMLFTHIFPCVAGASPAFQKEMAGLLGIEAGPDDSGEVYHLGGLGAYYTGPKKLFPGKGKYGQLYSFLPLIRWYDPDSYYNNDEFRPRSVLDGWYKNGQCVFCHEVENPGIVEQWRHSKHASPPEGMEVVGCDKCHGNNHTALIMPSYKLCGQCHPEQLKGHRDGGQGGHAHAYTVDLCEQGCQIEKPAEEVAGCLTCHAIAENRCDGCHSRHQFSVTEARKTGGCAVCHSGPEQYEYEMYMQSYHGQIYQNEAYEWDWSRPLTAKNYKVPTCAYCHMDGGDHNVMKNSTVYTYMGTSLVDRGAPRYQAQRERWVTLCKGCHSARFASDQLEAMDEGVKLSFTKYREAMELVVDLYKDGLLDPMPADLAPDWTGGHNFSLLPGGAIRKYNVSNIERLTYELLVDMTDAIYKAKAHGAVYSPIYGYWEWAQDRWLVRIKSEASRLRRIAEIEKKLGIERTAAYEFWKHGEYTDMYIGWKMKGQE
jgi:hydroxylamine dehydrogenase